MRTNHLAIATLSALVCVLAWTVLGKPSTVQSYAAGPVITTSINWEHRPKGCESDCLKGHRWGVRHAADLDQLAHCGHSEVAPCFSILGA